MAELVPGTMLADRYELESELGRGGMGTVWQARDERLGRAVAIKVLKEAADGSKRSAARFEREAKASAALRSPNIVEIYDYGFDRGGAPFMVMELLDGCTLQQRIRERVHLPLGWVANLVAQTARALAVAHDAGILHRDLKPANLFLVRDRDREIVKVLDFGLAKAFRGARAWEKITRTGAVVGTLAYISPEQVLSEPVDHRSDLWSLAVVAYAALTGRTPFRGQPGTLLDQICGTAAVAPSALVAELPAELDQFFEVALAKRPAARFTNAPQMGEELQRIARDAGHPECVLADSDDLPPLSTDAIPPASEQPTLIDSMEGTTRISTRRGESSQSLLPPPPRAGVGGWAAGVAFLVALLIVGWGLLRGMACGDRAGPEGAGSRATTMTASEGGSQAE